MQFLEVKNVYENVDAARLKTLILSVQKKSNEIDRKTESSNSLSRVQVKESRYFGYSKLCKSLPL